jgi:hypothetical protein
MDQWDPKTVVALAAVIVSACSLLFAWMSWLLTYRPIVTAFIEEAGEGGTFNLKVSNSGNRPALNVELRATKKAVDGLVESSATPQHRQAVEDCFLEGSSIPVLRNGETISTALGAFNKEEPWLNYGSEAIVTVRYRDLGCRRYKHKVPLKVFVREGFGGSVWRRST